LRYANFDFRLSNFAFSVGFCSGRSPPFRLCSAGILPALGLPDFLFSNFVFSLALVVAGLQAGAWITRISIFVFRISV